MTLKSFYMSVRIQTSKPLDNNVLRIPGRARDCLCLCYAMLSNALAYAAGLTDSLDALGFPIK